MRGILVAGAAIASLAALERINIERPRQDLPDRLSSDPKSPFYDRSILRKVGVRLDGVDRPKDVIAYDRTEGWIVIHVFENGNPVRNKNGTWKSKTLKGVVEPYWKNGAPEIFAPTPDPLPAAHFQSAAEAKRARKAEKLREAAEKGLIQKAARP